MERLLKHGGLSDQVQHDLMVVQRNARLLHRHVNDLLDIAKVEAGRMRMQYARINLASLTRLTASNFETLATDRKIHFEVQTPADLTAEVDWEKVERILINLLSNAFKFTPDGGAITLLLEERSGHGLISIHDTGLGVPANLREVIFERFRQVEGDTSRQYGGTGLGLAIVREFASLHGGKVSVTEAPGGGAQFNLDLPLTAPADTPVDEGIIAPDAGISRQALDELQQVKLSPSAPPSANLQGSRILLVEDNPEMNTFLAETLGKHYWVTRAFNGREGLEKALAVPPDLILSDIMMPIMSGEQMVAELRRHRFLDDVPIVMLTAKADDELRIKLLRHGVQDYLHKPFMTDEVLARVGGLLAERQRTRRRQQLSENRYRTLFERMTEGFMLGEIISDDADDADEPNDFRYLAVNSAFESQFGIHRHDIVGKTWREFSAGFEADLIEKYVKVALTGEPVLIENQFRTTGRFFVLYSFQTEPGQFGVLFMDITDRKQVEEQLRILNDELERRIELRTRELQETQLQVLHSEKLSAMGKLSASFAHEFNNPLQSLMTVLHSFHKWLNLEEEDRLLLDLAINEGKRMKKLILSLQDFSRPTSGKKILMDVHASLDSVLLLYTSEFQNKKITFVYNYADNLPRIKAIPDQITQVFFNLLNNAADACALHGGKKITISTCHDEKRVAIAIEDTGVGIDPERMDLIFQPFYSTKPEVKGTGLGLSVCHGIVQNHQGEIHVKSQPGKGSTFTVLLPIKEK